MRRLPRAVLPAALAALTGCAGVAARHAIPAPPADVDYVTAKREIIASLKHAQLETSDFKYATMAFGFKHKVREDGIDFTYTKYLGLLDSKGRPVETACDFEYLGELSVVEYNRGGPFHFEVPLGAACDHLGVYFGVKENAVKFATMVSALKLRAQEGRTGKAGLSREDLAAVVQAAVAGASAAPKPAAAAPKSDVDSPAARLPERAGDYAVVVGIETYSDLPPAAFAERDAETVKDHLIALGFPSRNVVHLAGEKAGYKALEKFLETWLPRNVDEQSRVFFYFSGHGAPEVKSGQAYLVPWDGDAAFLENTGYPLKRLYQKLGELKAKEVVVALDACFSGAGGRSVLAKGARPLVASVDLGAGAASRLTILAAASGEQMTSVLDEQGHGTFTYHFLKGLSGEAKDAGGAVTARGLHEYLKPRVEDAARRQNREQNPVLSGEPGRVLVRY